MAERTLRRPIQQNLSLTRKKEKRQRRWSVTHPCETKWRKNSNKKNAGKEHKQGWRIGFRYKEKKRGGVQSEEIECQSRAWELRAGVNL